MNFNSMKNQFQPKKKTKIWKWRKIYAKDVCPHVWKEMYVFLDHKTVLRSIWYNHSIVSIIVAFHECFFCGAAAFFASYEWAWFIHIPG